MQFLLQKVREYVIAKIQRLFTFQTGSYRKNNSSNIFRLLFGIVIETKESILQEFRLEKFWLLFLPFRKFTKHNLFLLYLLNVLLPLHRKLKWRKLSWQYIKIFQRFLRDQNIGQTQKNINNLQKNVWKVGQMLEKIVIDIFSRNHVVQVSRQITIFNYVN